jgi:hypothetical protein
MKCLNVFFLLTQKYFPDPFNDSFKSGGGIPSLLLLFVTKMHYPTHNSISCITFWTPKLSLYPCWDPLHGIKTIYNANPLILQGYTYITDLFIYKNRKCLKIPFVIVGGCEE